MNSMLNCSLTVGIKAYVTPTTVGIKIIVSATKTGLISKCADTYLEFLPKYNNCVNTILKQTIKIKNTM